jgi:hypothetical protein
VRTVLLRRRPRLPVVEARKASADVALTQAIGHCGTVLELQTSDAQTNALVDVCAADRRTELHVRESMIILSRAPPAPLAILPRGPPTPSEESPWTTAQSLLGDE